MANFYCVTITFISKNLLISIFNASAILPNTAIVKCLFRLLFSISHMYCLDNPVKSARSCWVKLFSKRYLFMFRRTIS